MTGRMCLDLYLVTDNRLTAGRPLESIVEEAVRAGVTLVQYRDKDADDGAFADKAIKIIEICHNYGVPVLLNDRAHLVTALGADGVHLGQDDLPVREARTLVPPGAIVGVSVRDTAQAKAAQCDGADYAAVSGVFPTGTKADVGEVLGLRGVSDICRAVSLPVVAIGGITAANAAQVVRAGARGVAVVTAITLAPKVDAAVKCLLAAVAAGRAARASDAV